MAISLLFDGQAGPQDLKHSIPELNLSPIHLATCYYSSLQIPSVQYQHLVSSRTPYHLVQAIIALWMRIPILDAIFRENRFRASASVQHIIPPSEPSHHRQSEFLARNSNLYHHTTLGFKFVKDIPVEVLSRAGDGNTTSLETKALSKKSTL